MAPGVSSTMSSTPVACLERADVASFAADDAPLQVVARQIDDRDRGFDGGVGGAALDGVGDDVLRAGGGGLAGFRLEALDQVRGVAPRVPLDLLEQQLARFVRAQARDALQLALPLRDELVDARGGGRGALLAGGDGLLAAADLLFGAVARREAIRERACLLRQPQLERADLLTPIAGLALGCLGQLVRFLARLERGFLADALGVALGLPEDAFGFVGGFVKGVGRGAPA